MPKYGNIFLTDTLETYSYSGTGGGKQPRLPPIPNRQAHSSKLQQQFSVAQAQFNAYIPTQTAAIGQSRGTFLEFTGAQDCDLITKSLESPRSGIHLMNVRNIETTNANGSVSFVKKATVYIPIGKEDFFIKRITEYADTTKATKNGNPKNEPMVSSIESIANALTISAFWVGRLADVPSTNKQWFELWIFTEEDTWQETKSSTFAVFDSLQITHRPETEFVHFPEILVLPVYANQTDMLNLIRHGVKLSEIRKPADPNTFFVDSSLTEQTSWASDLLDRVQFNNTNVSVCVLDTGVNRNHRLITPYMPQSGMTIEQSWGVDDREGHGTGMAGVALFDNLKSKLISSQVVELNHTLESVKILEPNSTMVTDLTLYGEATERAALLR